MTGSWPKIYPFVLSVGGHIGVLMLLCMSWSSAPVRSTSGLTQREQDSAVQATLITSAAPSEIPPIAPRQAQALPQSLHRHIEPSAPGNADSESKRIAKQIVAQPSNDEDRKVDVRSTHQKNQSDLAVDASQATPQPSDPYAEMRRQRAEAERNYQISEQSAQQTPMDGEPSSPVVATALSPTPSFNEPIVAPFDASAFVQQDSNSQTMICTELGTARPPDDDDSTEWLDCLLNSAWQRWTFDKVLWNRQWNFDVEVAYSNGLNGFNISDSDSAP